MAQWKSCPLTTDKGEGGGHFFRGITENAKVQMKRGFGYIKKRLDCPHRLHVDSHMYMWGCAFVVVVTFSLDQPVAYKQHSIVMLCWIHTTDTLDNIPVDWISLSQVHIVHVSSGGRLQYRWWAPSFCLSYLIFQINIKLKTPMFLRKF